MRYGGAHGAARSSSLLAHGRLAAAGRDGGRLVAAEIGLLEIGLLAIGLDFRQLEHAGERTQSQVVLLTLSVESLLPVTNMRESEDHATCGRTCNAYRLLVHTLTKSSSKRDT